MTDDEWLTEAQRTHNLETFRHQTPKRYQRKKIREPDFTTQQLNIALAVYDRLSPERQALWVTARNRMKEDA